MLALLALTFAPDAHACGGFACDQAQPVLQNAERIVFGIDEDRGEVEMHVQISYEGPSEDFAWIVPVPQEPDLFLTTSALFTQLAFATLPTFALQQRDEGHCNERDDMFKGASEMAFADAATSASDWSSSAYDVTVVGSESVGPYDTVTLKADSSEDLLGWLQTNGYDIPDAMEDVLAPYVVRDAYFVALKLQKDKDTGDLAPLAMRFDAQKATVPVQLTAIAATPDMRMEAYVFGKGRGVPESYLHVQINDAAINWWNAGANYDEVITKAANEAGGHAFATDYYGPSDIAGAFWSESAFDEQAFASASTPLQMIQLLRPAILATPPELFTALENAFGLNPGDGASFWSCPDCFSTSTYGQGVDAAAAVAILTESVVDPLRSNQELVDRFPKLARMTSSLDAVEMTVDPVFVLNHDLASEEVDRNHAADLVYECGNGRRRDKAPRRLELADGRSIELPSEKWLDEHGMTEFEYIADLGDTKAQIIEQMGAEGQPVVIADHTQDLFDLVDLHNKMMGCGAGGCSSTGAGGAGLVGAMSLLAIRRRRA